MTDSAKNRPLTLSEGLAIAAAIADLGTSLLHIANALPLDERAAALAGLASSQNRLIAFLADTEVRSEDD